MAPPTLKVAGIGIAYPPHRVLTEDLEKLAHKWHEPSPALNKVLAINRRTGIKSHTLVYPWNELPAPASIKEVVEIFFKEGLPLAIAASRSAIAEANVSMDEITHVVGTTCTNVSNPGFDCVLAQELGLRPSVEKVLLQGVGCAGGLAALRLAASLCQSASWRGEPAHVLVVACEITSPMRRDELEIISREQQVRIGVTLFGDGASALVLSLAPGLEGSPEVSKGIYELVNWAHLTVPDTDSDLRIDADVKGFKPTLSGRIPSLTAPCTPLLYEKLLNTLPNKPAFPTLPSTARDFDWALHPGGAAILSAIQDVMSLDREHMKASWEVYENHGNTSSTTVLSVLDTVRRTPGREWVMSAAFGPGVCAEGVLLRRVEQ